MRGSLLLVLAAVMCVACNETITTPSPIDVRGVAVDYFGAPVAGVTIAIDDRPGVVAAADGSFEFLEIEPPYDLLLLNGSSNLSHPAATLYEGLTTAFPQIECCTSISQVFPRTTIRTQFPLEPGELARLSISNVDGPVVWFRDIAESSFEFAGNWFYPSDTDYTVALLKSFHAPGDEARYVSIAVKRVTIVAGGSRDVVFAASDLITVNESSIAGRVGLAGGDTLTLRSVTMKWRGASIPLKSEGERHIPGTAPSNFDDRVPDAPGATFTVRASTAHSTGWFRGLQAGQVDMVLELEDPVQLSSPSAGETVVDYGSDFAWTLGSGRGVYQIVMLPIQQPSVGFISIYTRNQSIRFPDLSRFGVAPPSGTTFNWGVNEQFDVFRVDAVVESKPPELRGWTSSQPQQFTFGTP